MVALLMIALFNKNSINHFISEKMKEQTDIETTRFVQEFIKTEYNYTINNLEYEFTLLEFGSNSCVPCKQMEPVLEEIRKSERVKVNVVFLNTMKPENLSLMKYFGISAIPMQILLDKQGKEFYRHYGFISANDLMTKTSEINSK